MRGNIWVFLEKPGKENGSYHLGFRVSAFHSSLLGKNEGIIGVLAFAQDPARLLCALVCLNQWSCNTIVHFIVYCGMCRVLSINGMGTNAKGITNGPHS